MLKFTGLSRGKDLIPLTEGKAADASSAESDPNRRLVLLVGSDCTSALHFRLHLKHYSSMKNINSNPACKKGEIHSLCAAYATKIYEDGTKGQNQHTNMKQ